MTRDKYLDMMEQLGKEPSDAEIPPDWEDLPEIMAYAINTFNSLGDRVYPDIGYTGKDYTNLPMFLNAISASSRVTPSISNIILPGLTTETQ